MSPTKKCEPAEALDLDEVLPVTGILPWLATIAMWTIYGIIMTAYALAWWSGKPHFGPFHIYELGAAVVILGLVFTTATFCNIALWTERIARRRIKARDGIHYGSSRGPTGKYIPEVFDYGEGTLLENRKATPVSSFKIGVAIAIPILMSLSLGTELFGDKPAALLLTIPGLVASILGIVLVIKSDWNLLAKQDQLLYDLFQTHNEVIQLENTLETQVVSAELSRARELRSALAQKVRERIPNEIAARIGSRLEERIKAYESEEAARPFVQDRVPPRSPPSRWS